MNTKKWYTSNKTGAQPIIIDEQTGATIAVCYQDKDGNQLEHATLIANAPDMLKALIMCESITDRCNNAMLPQHVQELLKSLNDTMKEAIKKATD